MKIISWNINALSKRKSKLSFILRQNADIICLQEVTDAFLKEFRNSKYYVYACAESKGRKGAYSVILSKSKAKSHKIIDYDNMHRSFWLSVLRLLGGINIMDSIGHYIDFRGLRVINLHLHSFASPQVRLEEFSSALTYKKEKTVICGDLNTYGVWYINWFLSFILKIKIKDILRNEIKEFNELFLKNKIKNLFKGKKTARFVNLTKHHTDYILITQDIKEVENKIFKFRHGSDHHMIMAVIR